MPGFPDVCLATFVIQICQMVKRSLVILIPVGAIVTGNDHQGVFLKTKSAQGIRYPSNSSVDLLDKIAVRAGIGASDIGIRWQPRSVGSTQRDVQEEWLIYFRTRSDVLGSLVNKRVEYVFVHEAGRHFSMPPENSATILFLIFALGIALPPVHYFVVLEIVVGHDVQ